MRVVLQTDNPEAQADSNSVVLGSPIDGMSEEEFAALARKILVVVPHRSSEGIHEGICIHWGLWARWGLRVAEVIDPHGGFIEIVRAGIVRVFLDHRKLNPEIEYLIMIDNDERIEWDAPWRLARHGVPVCTGVVCGFTEKKGIFACFTVKSKDGGAYFPTLKHTGIMPREGLVEVHQTGTGLLCVRHDVFETMLACGDVPFYIPEEIRRNAATSGDLHKSEDITFSDMCEKYGFKRYADLSVHAVHYKRIGIDWPDEKRLDSLPASEWDVKPHNPES